MNYTIVYGWSDQPTKHKFSSLEEANKKLSELEQKFPYIQKRVMLLCDCGRPVEEAALWMHINLHSKNLSFLSNIKPKKTKMEINKNETIRYET